MRSGNDYFSPPAIGKKSAEVAFMSGNADTICRALLGVALHHPDWRWVEDWCIRLSSYPDENVSALTATCLSHLARLHGHLSQEKTLPVLEALLQGPTTAGYANDALNTIVVFLKSDATAYKALQNKYIKTLPKLPDPFK